VVALSERFGKLPFERLFAPALDYARDGFHVTPVIAANWARGAESLRDQPGFAEAFMPEGRAPRAGDLFTNPQLAGTLEAIATSRGRAFYHGHLAEAMTRHAAACGGAMTMADLAQHRADWCGTLSAGSAEVALHEMPPNGQGLASLIAFGILSRLGIERYAVDSPESMHLQIEAMKLGVADAEAYVADPEAMKVDARWLLRDEYLAERAALIDPKRAGDFGAGVPKAGGTVYMCAGDASGMMVSFIQSNYEGFGSGVVVPGTGISMQNRGIGFVLDAGHPNEVGPSKRPFHTIIPGFVMRGGKPAMVMGLQGGPMQAQGHLQLTVRTQLFGQNPQAATDAPRWRLVEGLRIAVEHGTPDELVRGLEALGHVVQKDGPQAVSAFGGAQLICRLDSGYVAGSDHRKDGCAVGF
jgi:gamma-glutamyltranspeptidase/glutathione hydrolase